MKRFKHLWMTLLILVLAVSVVIGGAGLSAFGADSGLAATPIISAATRLPTSVNLGETINVGVTSTTNLVVKAPNGDKITNVTTEYVAESGTGYLLYTAKIPGNYEISYGSGVNTYTHTVNCKLDGEFEFRVANGGADIPTYIKAGTVKELPAAKLYKKNTDTDEFEEAVYENGTAMYTVDVYLDNVPVQDLKTVSYTTGAHTVQYVATIKNTKKIFTKEFTVKAQQSFDDTVSPTLSISGIPTEASLNTKVTLPKATTTDNFDQNVRVHVTVTHEGKVLKVNTNEYGYATGTIAGKEEIFDNVYNMSFYPTKEATYVVTYMAEDDNGKTSVKHTHNIVVRDKTAPKLEKIDDTKIPSVWGKQIQDEANKDTTNYSSSKVINFPFPVYSDNDGAKNEDGTNRIAVSFEIRDTVNNNTVIKFNDIYDYTVNGTTVTYGEGAKYTYSDTNPAKGLYDAAGITFNKDSGFDFVLANYTSKVPSLTTTGTYTVIYQARDNKPNITTKSYEITVEDKHIDTVAPSIVLDADEYLFVDKDYQEYTLPLAAISDAVDSRTTVLYTLKTTKGVNPVNIDVENGAKIKISSTKIEYDEKEYEYDGSSIIISVTATDNVGNKKVNPDKTITIARAGDFTQNVGSKVVLSIDSDIIKTDSSKAKTNTVLKAGKLEINSFNEVNRKFSGFELSLTDPNGDVVSGLSFDTYVKFADTTNAFPNRTNGKMYIENIEFTPSMVTDSANGKVYTLTVRAFDISGRSLVQSYKFEVEKKTGGGSGTTSAQAIEATGSVNISYKLKNETAEDLSIVESKNYIVRRISGAGKLSLMGLEFTAYSAGKYSFTDAYYMIDPANPTGTTGIWTTLSKPYYLDAKDTANPVFELLGPMPTNAKKIDKKEAYADTDYLKLPQIIAHNDYANAKIEVSVRTSLGATSLTLGKDLIYNETTNVYSFLPTEDDEYIVTCKASVGSVEVEQIYKIKVGDIIAPTFTLKSSHTTSVVQESKFQFVALAYSEGNLDELSKVTFTKKLYDPNGDVVYSVEGEGQTGLDKVQKDGEDYVFSKTGTYTVEYTATDKVGNDSVERITISVNAKGSASNVAWKVVRTVLIIVGVILLAGVILYFVRYRKVKVKAAR